MRISLYFSILALVFSTSCAGLKHKKWLSSHQQTLSDLAKSDVGAEAKLDGLFSTYVQLMGEGMRFGNPVKGAKYIQTFQDQNKESIEMILRDAEKWRSGLSIQQGIELGLSVPKKPYAKDFISLAPKFRKKYQQYKFIADMTGKVGGGFGKVAGKLLSI
jgi:hypothetical protein